MPSDALSGDFNFVVPRAEPWPFCSPVGRLRLHQKMSNLASSGTVPHVVPDPAINRRATVICPGPVLVFVRPKIQSNRWLK